MEKVKATNYAQCLAPQLILGCPEIVSSMLSLRCREVLIIERLWSTIISAAEGCADRSRVEGGRLRAEEIPDLSQR